MIAMATAVSAADIAIEKSTKKYPSVVPGKRKRLKKAKFISVAFSINSTEISIAKVLRLVKKPYIPANIIIVETTR